MNYRYEVALSFAGEDRAFGESVARDLRNQIAMEQVRLIAGDRGEERDTD